MDRRARLVTVLLASLSGVLSACARGINAGGESPTNNGGVAFIAMTGMLVLLCVVLWVILGRGE